MTMTAPHAEKIFTTLMSDENDKQLSSFFNFAGNLSNLSTKRKHRFRAFLSIQQGFLCCYCKRGLTLEKPKADRQLPNYATFEHVRDVFEGGGKKDDRCSSIKVACYECNVSRGSAQNERALRYYGQFFVKKYTLMRFVAHPKVGWAGIIREFGPIPDGFK